MLQQSCLVPSASHFNWSPKALFGPQGLLCCSAGHGSTQLPLPASRLSLQTTCGHHGTFSKMGIWFWSPGAAYHNRSGQKAPAEHIRAQRLALIYLPRLTGQGSPQPSTAVLSVHAAVHAGPLASGAFSGLDDFSHHRTQFQSLSFTNYFPEKPAEVTHSWL